MRTIAESADHPGAAPDGVQRRPRAPEFPDAVPVQVAEAPWSVAEWAVALRCDNPRAAVVVLLLG